MIKTRLTVRGEPLPDWEKADGSGRRKSSPRHFRSRNEKTKTPVRALYLANYHHSKPQSPSLGGCIRATHRSTRGNG